MCSRTSNDHIKYVAQVETPAESTMAKLVETPLESTLSKPVETPIRVHYYNRPPWIPMDIFSKCDNKCYLTAGEGNAYTESDVVVFHTPYVTEKHPPKKMGQIWVFHSLEPPWIHWIKFNNWKSVFNWTISYRRDADITNPYGMFSKRKYNKSVLKKESNELYKTWLNKSKDIVWMVSKCKTSGNRDIYVKELKKVATVDVYGKCGTKNCPKENTTKCLEPYRFYLSFENDICEDYITEKSFKLFESKVVTLPIIRSGSNLSMFLPPGSYIDTSTFKHKLDLVKYVKSLSKHKIKFKKYIQWRKHYQLNDGTTHYMAFCELCRRLHLKDILKYQRLYTDIGEWLRGENPNESHVN
ncbi:alpha-(1,3)-fucosyltransferase C-like [Pecten maximus]|uniref:alpha-(1,3)-fucosyltransferase C-like n=1 Tax=Pecten maximus TaxID=6579 RepID=UPI00145867F4|nr:alpha-(1,3)-fucosyltransferase C-like [Pecten maximus]